MNDLKYALRTLIKSPAFTVVAVLTLALGTGASTAIFSVLDAVLLRPLPYPNQERIVELRELDDKGRGMSFAEPNFNDLVARQHSFEALAKYNAFPDAIVGGGEPVRANVSAASPDFFRVLGATPVVGRVLTEDTASKEAVVVSYSFWKRFLGGRTPLVGMSPRFNNHSSAVIGGLPPEIEFPPSTAFWFPADIFPPNTSRTA